MSKPSHTALVVLCAAVLTHPDLRSQERAPTTATQLHYHPADGWLLATRWVMDGPAGGESTALAQMVQKGPLAEMAQAMRAEFTAWVQALMHKAETLPGGAERFTQVQHLYDRCLQLHPIGARAWSHQRAERPDYVIAIEFARDDAALLDQIIADLQQLSGSQVSALSTADLGGGVPLRIIGNTGQQQTGFARFGTSVLCCMSEPSRFGRLAADPAPVEPGATILLQGRTGCTVTVPSAVLKQTTRNSSSPSSKNSST